MHLEIRDLDGKKKYYLSRSYREGGKVKKVRVYLGENLKKSELNAALKSAKDRMLEISAIRMLPKDNANLRRLLIGVTALVAVIGIILVASLLNYSQSNPGNVLISLTDPANVPSGTQVLSITWSGLAVHTIEQNGSGWIPIKSTGSVDLLSLANSSISLGSLNLANGTIINMVKFNITSASIEINNTVYQVYLTNSQISASVSGTQLVNGTAQFLVDLFPTVIPIFSANSTSFLMETSVEANRIYGPIIGRAIGSGQELNQQAIRYRDAWMPNISISSVLLSNEENITDISVKVTDNSNRSVMLTSLSVSGDELATPSQPSASKNSMDIGFFMASFKQLDFLINSTGNLYLPFIQCEQQKTSGPYVTASPSRAMCPKYVNYLNFEQGFLLSPGESITLTFDGEVQSANGNFITNIIPGHSYRIIVQGDQGAIATSVIVSS